MGRRPKYRAEDFPPPGTVFVAPTSDGRYAAGRVLRCQFEGGAQAALIATTPFLGAEIPPLDLPELKETLWLSHHSWKGVPDLCWVFDLMPPSFVAIGQIALSAADHAAKCNAFGGWLGVPLAALNQWRWDHDREALLREEAQHAADQFEANRLRAARHAELLSTLTLDALAERTWFSSWSDSVSEIPLNECRTSIGNLICQLQNAPKLTLTVVKKHVKQSVNELNRLDTEHHFITTIEREELYDAYEQIVCAARFPQVIDQVDNWRDW